MNNLIFDFENYDMKLSKQNNEYTITFDHKAVGGFMHANAPSAYVIFEHIHGLPDTLQYKSTTHVNTINISYEMKYDKCYFTSVYKAIEVL